MPKSITVLDPAAKTGRKELKVAALPDRLEGKVGGLLWNSKPGGDILLNRLAEKLNERFHFLEILKHKKPHSACGVEEQMLFKFSEKCDFVIIGVGD